MDVWVIINRLDFWREWEIDRRDCRMRVMMRCLYQYWRKREREKKNRKSDFKHSFIYHWVKNVECGLFLSIHQSKVRCFFFALARLFSLKIYLSIHRLKCPDQSSDLYVYWSRWERNVHQGVSVHIIHIRWWFNNGNVNIMIIISRWNMISTCRWSISWLVGFECSLRFVEFLQKIGITTTEKKNIIGIDCCSFSMSK